MSDLLSSPDDEDGDSRQRAMWGLLVLALAAVVIIALVLLFAGTSGGGHHSQGVIGTDEPTTPDPSTTASASRSSSFSKPPSTSAPPTPAPTSTANPCLSAKACAVAGDGGAVAALNAFRVSHGRRGVPGSVSVEAQECALRQGDGPTCVPHYSWQPVPVQDGARGIALIAGGSSGQKWLLDPAMTSFSIGWAYATGQFELAVLKVG